MTPPLASEMPWTFLDDDPLGVFTELSNELESMKCPPTPPPLRALRLTSHKTTDSISEMYKKIRNGLPDPLDRITSGNKDLIGNEPFIRHIGYLSWTYFDENKLAASLYKIQEKS